MIPADKNDAVFRGLHEAFGTTSLDEIRTISQGLGSDLVFRIVVQGSPFLLSIVTRIDQITDPTRRFACMAAASDAGIAPRVRYANAQDGIAISDFIEALPLSTGQVSRELPGLLRRLHALPPFLKTFNYVTAHNGFIWKFRGAGLLPDVEEVFASYERVCATYPRLDDDMVSSHGDVKPENIVFDGQRLWLMGWQAAFINDRYFDLAVAANYIGEGGLDAYFGKPPDEYQLARFFLMRQMVHMLSATVFLMIGAAGKPISPTLKTPTFEDFHRWLWAGEVDLADNDMKVVCGMVHWKQLSENVRRARFSEALGIVAERDKGATRLLPLPG